LPTPSPTTYALADVIRHTGAKRPQIEYWVRKGLIRGEFEHGTGLPRQFVFRNLVEISFAVDLTKLGVRTEAIESMLDRLRYGDVETDVRTKWFVEAISEPAIEYRKPSRKQLREMREMREMREQMQAIDDITPREERCCADLNDDGTLKLLRLLRAYVDEGVSVVEARKALMAVAREHLRDHRRWDRKREEFDKRWRQFKNPKSRPANAQFFLVATLRSSDDEKQTWLHAALTDFKDKDEVPRDRAAIIVSIRETLERLETATTDSWPATPENRVHKHRSLENEVSARQLVDQAFQEYEKAERIKELRALGKLPPAKEQVHAH
jgi:DNA-binding transcriptional MerR regulator